MNKKKNLNTIEEVSAMNKKVAIETKNNLKKKKNKIFNIHNAVHLYITLYIYI